MTALRVSARIATQRQAAGRLPRVCSARYSQRRMRIGQNDLVPMADASCSARFPPQARTKIVRFLVVFGDSSNGFGESFR